MTHTVLAQSQTGKLTEKAKTDFFERLSKALDVATPLRRRHRKFKRLVVQMDRQARAPLDMDAPRDVNRKILMDYGPEFWPPFFKYLTCFTLT